MRNNMITYNEIKHPITGKLYWWRVIGHRGGRSYEVSEPQESAKGRKVLRRNVSWWVVDEKPLIYDMIKSLEHD